MKWSAYNSGTVNTTKKIAKMVAADDAKERGHCFPRREWVGLDEVEITGITCECVDDGTFNMSCAHDFARAIEKALKEKNT
jgi:hypothetical protein